MADNTSALALRVHLTNGQVLAFQQQDQKLARRNLLRLAPDQVFKDTLLIVAGDSHVTSIPTGAITRLDVFADPKPEWTLPAAALDLHLVDEAAFAAHVEKGEADGSLRRDQHRAEGDTVTSFHELQMSSGERLHLRAEVVVRSWSVQARAIHRLMESPSLVASLADGWMTQVNPRAIVSLVSRPGPEEISSRAIFAHHVTEPD